MTIVSKVFRTMGGLGLALLVAGCASQQVAPGYGPGVVTDQTIQPQYAESQLGSGYAEPSGYYSDPVGVYQPAPYYAPGYAYDPYPFYGGSSLSVAFFGNRYYDNYRPGKSRSKRVHNGNRNHVKAEQRNNADRREARQNRRASLTPEERQARRDRRAENGNTRAERRTRRQERREARLAEGAQTQAVATNSERRGRRAGPRWRGNQR